MALEIVKSGERLIKDINQDVQDYLSLGIDALFTTCPPNSKKLQG